MTCIENHVHSFEEMCSPVSVHINLAPGCLVHVQVVELVLIRDKMTKTPKGSAFLWYKQKSEV